MGSRRPAARVRTPPVKGRDSKPAVPESGHNILLGPRDRVIGQHYVEGDLRVQGTVDGEVVVTGEIEIDDTAKVKASVSGRDISIRGHVNGPVTARRRLVVASSGALIGDVRVARLIVKDGATLNGHISMSAPGEAAVTLPEGDTPLVQPTVAPSADGKTRPGKRNRKVKKW